MFMQKEKETLHNLPPSMRCEESGVGHVLHKSSDLIIPHDCEFSPGPPEPPTQVPGVEDNPDADFLDTVFATVPEDHVLSLWCKRGEQKFTVWVCNTPEGRENCCRQAVLYSRLGFDAYFSPAFCAAAGTAKDRMTNDRATGIPGVWADIDVGKPGTPASIEEALDFLLGLPLLPSLITRSGRGLHALWLLERAWVFTGNEDKRRGEALTKGWVAYLNSIRGYTFDAVGDLARVLRMPGTKNYKPENRTPEGEAPPVNVMHHDTVWYHVEELERYALPVPVSTVSRSEAPTDREPGDWLKAQPHTCQLSPDEVLRRARNLSGDEFTSLYDGGDLSECKGDRSRADMKLCHMLAGACGYDPHVIDALFRHSVLMREKWDECHSADGKTYGELTMSKVVRGAVRPPDDTPEPDEDGSVAPVKTDAQNKRVIIINGRDPHDVGTDMLDAVSAANQAKPRLFVHNGTPVRVTLNEKGEPVQRPLAKEALRCELTEVAVCVKHDAKGVPKPDLPKLEFMGDLLARRELPFPKLTGLTNSPVLRDDWSLVTNYGYDPLSGWYYYPGGTECAPHVPEHPTREDAMNAVRYLREHPFAGFPFVGDADYANTLAFALAVLLRPVLGLIPLVEVTATKARTGKGKLVNAVSLMTTGRYASSILYTPGNDGEMRKSITTHLASANAVVNFDNVEGELKSTAVTKLLTDYEWTDRWLGGNTAATFRNNKVWCTTMNNGRLCDDLQKRTMRIALDAERPDPWARPATDFRCHPLEDYCLRERGVLLGHLLTLVRAYDEAGRPPAKHVPTLGGYDTFTHTVGGILEYAGVEGFLGNLEEVIGTGEAEWVFFLLHVTSFTGGEPFTATALLEHFQRQSGAQQLPLDGFPDEVAEVLSGSTVGNLAHKLGKLLGRHKGTRYGDLGIRLEKTTTKVNGCYRWVVRADDMDTVTARVEELRKGADA